MSKLYKEHTLSKCMVGGCVACLRDTPLRESAIDGLTDVLPDYQPVLLETGRGSMQRRIAQLENALIEAKAALCQIAAGCDSKCLVADRALGKLEEICGKGTNR